MSCIVEYRVNRVMGNEEITVEDTLSKYQNVFGNISDLNQILTGNLVM